MGNYSLSNNPSKFVDLEFLSDWIIKNNIIDIILGENAHDEIIKRSNPLWTLLIKTKKLSDEYIKKLWNCTQEKHEAIVYVVYDLIIELSHEFSSDHLL